MKPLVMEGELTVEDYSLFTLVGFESLGESLIAHCESESKGSLYMHCLGRVRLTVEWLDEENK